ncbi:MAG TPA: TolC family protein [Phycisphaerae bacterium]|nr:TolC family protein [Phycisphaerae bacterium]
MYQTTRHLVRWSTSFVVVLCGCATVNPRLDYERAGRHVTEATGQTQVYRPEEEERVEGLVQELLVDGLTSDEAARICLLNNPGLQAAFMNVGMARADVVQAGLLSNPSLGISVQLPAGGGLVNLEGALAQNIADLWQIPARRRAAERSLDRAVLELAREAADLATDAKVTYFEAVGADGLHHIAVENHGIARSLLELALARQQAGEAAELEVNLSRSFALEAELAVEAARLGASDARRGLAALLGIGGDADELVLLDGLPDVPPQVPDPEGVIELARRQRLDIQAARQMVSVAEARLQEERWRLFPAVEIGVGLEREAREREEGRDILADTARASIANGGLTAPSIQPRSERGQSMDFIIGPSLDIELPIFDQNQAQIAKAEYACQQARKTLEALDRAVVQEVRAAVDGALTAWRLAEAYRARAIPLAEANLELSRESYRAGRASFLAVLEAERFYLASRSRYVRAAQAAATKVPELERAAGLPLSSIKAELEGETMGDDGGFRFEEDGE